MRLMVIGGFLGAGKTSLLAAWALAEAAAGRRVTVLENDVGRFGVDQALLASLGLAVRNLAGGCVCCDLEPLLIAHLTELAGQVPPPDWVFIEPSGVAMLGEVLATLAPWRARGHDLAALAVVDASRFALLQRGLPELLASQVETVDRLVVSKLDMMNAPEAALAAIRAAAPAARLFPADLRGEGALPVARALADELAAPAAPLLRGAAPGAPPRPLALSLDLVLPPGGFPPDAALGLVADLAGRLFPVGGPPLGHVKLLAFDHQGRPLVFSATSSCDASQRGGRPGGAAGLAPRAQLAVLAHHLPELQGRDLIAGCLAKLGISPAPTSSPPAAIAPRPF